VLLEPGTYQVEWFSVDDRQTIPGAATTVESSTGISFSLPSAVAGPAVLYLRKVGR
jgi:hypothetical protein